MNPAPQPNADVIEYLRLRASCFERDARRAIDIEQAVELMRLAQLYLREAARIEAGAAKASPLAPIFSPPDEDEAAAARNPPVIH